MSTNSTNTGGGAAIGGNASASQDFIGRDQTNIHIQTVVLQIAQTLPTAQDTPTAEWQACAERYRDSIYKNCNYIRMLGQQATKPLNMMYTDVYIVPEYVARQKYNVDLNKYFDHSFEKYEKKVQKERILAKDLLNLVQNNRLFILGKPGAGKTTFLNYIAMEAARGKLDKLPIFINLRDWSDSNLGLNDFIVKQFTTHLFPYGMCQRVDNNFKE